MKHHFITLFAILSLLSQTTCKSRDRSADLSEGVTIGPDGEVFVFFKREGQFHIRKCEDLTTFENPSEIETKCPQTQSNFKIIPEKYFSPRLASMFFLSTMKGLRESSELACFENTGTKTDRKSEAEFQKLIAARIKTIETFQGEDKEALGKYAEELKLLKGKLTGENYQDSAVEEFNKFIEKNVAAVAASNNITKYRASNPDEALITNMLKSLYYESPDLTSWYKERLISNAVSQYPDESTISESNATVLADGKILYAVELYGKARVKDAPCLNAAIRIYDPKTGNIVRQVDFPQPEVICGKYPQTIRIHNFWAGSDKILINHANDNKSLILIGKENQKQQVTFAGGLRSNIASLDDKTIVIAHEDISKEDNRRVVVFKIFNLLDSSEKFLYSVECPNDNCRLFTLSSQITDDKNLLINIHFTFSNDVIEQHKVSTHDGKLLDKGIYLLPQNYFKHPLYLKGLLTDTLTVTSGANQDDYNVFVLDSKNKASSFPLNIGGALLGSSVNILDNGSFATLASNQDKLGKITYTLTAVDPFTKKFARIANEKIQEKGETSVKSPYKEITHLTDKFGDHLLSTFKDPATGMERIYKLQTFSK